MCLQDRTYIRYVRFTFEVCGATSLMPSMSGEQGTEFATERIREVHALKLRCTKWSTHLDVRRCSQLTHNEAQSSRSRRNATGGELVELDLKLGRPKVGKPAGASATEIRHQKPESAESDPETGPMDHIRLGNTLRLSSKKWRLKNKINPPSHDLIF